MVAPAISVELVEDLTKGLTVRASRKMFKAINTAAAETWEGTFLKQHFVSGAAKRYSYSPRAKSTIEKKKNLAARGIVKAGGRLPLVHTGVLRRAMGRHHVITATPGKATVNLVGPQYFSIRFLPGKPNLGNEVTRIIPEELRVIQDAGETAAKKFLDSPDAKRKRKVTIK